MKGPAQRTACPSFTFFQFLEKKLCRTGIMLCVIISDHKVTPCFSWLIMKKLLYLGICMAYIALFLCFPPKKHMTSGTVWGTGLDLNNSTHSATATPWNVIDAFVHCFLHFTALQLLGTSGSWLSYCEIERPYNFRMCIPKKNNHFVITSFMTW